MARKPTVRYWKSRNGYCCWIKGKQVLLAAGPDDALAGPTYLAALDKFRDLLTLGHAGNVGDNNTLLAICELWARHMESRRKPATLENRKNMLRGFIAAYGNLRVRELKHLTVYNYLDAQQSKKFRPWADSTCGTFIRSLSAAINWAVKGKLIRENPLIGIEVPPGRSRSGDILLTPEQHQLVLAKCCPWLRRFVVVLEATGCRPGELRHTTAWNFDADARSLTFKGDERNEPGRFRHKNSTKGKDRVIFPTGEALAVIRSLVEKYPTGPIFRRPNGKPIRRRTLSAAFQKLREPTGMPKLIPLSYRHTFATNWILSGRSIEVLAKLIGNSAQTIRLNYSHLYQHPDGLRDAMEEFRNQK